MTSTNDGKELKSNETSSPKGKTYLIELHKSLDARLSQDCELRARSELLKSAWQHIHTLCLHSTANTHAYLLSWIQRHTAKTVLQTEWQSSKTPSIEAIHDTLRNGLDHFIQECEAAQSRSSFLWESQLLQRARWFHSVLPNPWEHPVLRLLLDPRGTQPSDEEILEWLKVEHGTMFVCRVRQLASSKSVSDLALLLASAVMDRARADQPCDKGEEPPVSKSSTFTEILTNEAGFTEEVWDLLIDIELVLLHKNDRTDKCIERARQTPFESATKLVERLQNRLITSPREKKLWKNCKEVAILIAQVVVARCMVVAVCAGPCRSALRGAARALAALLPPPRLAAAAAALAAPAATARHLHTLARAVDHQCGGERKSFVCELYVRAITAGMNELEQLKLSQAKDVEARAAEQTLGAWFTQLGLVLKSSARIHCECILTAFSVHPSPAMYETIKSLPQFQKLQEQPQEAAASTSEFGSWASDSRSQTNFVKTSETLNIKHTHQGNVLSTALLSEGEALGLAPELCQDLAVLLSGPRIKTLAWEMDREELLENCRIHMERTSCGTRPLTTELKYLNLDPKTYQHLPEEEDDADDMYYGIEKGYEHLVEFQDSPTKSEEPSYTPAAIWQHESDFEEDDASGDSDFDVPKRRSKKKTKKQLAQSSSDENEPMSLAELKELKKKERPHSKERSQQRKKSTKQRSRSQSKETHDRSQTKNKKDNSQSKERKKEKKGRKKKEKPTPGAQDILYSSSLAQLIGTRVSEIDNTQTSPIYLNERPLNVPLPGPSYDPLSTGYNQAFLAHLQAQSNMAPPAAASTNKVKEIKPKKSRVRTMQTKVRNIVGHPRNLSPQFASPLPRPASSTPRHSSPMPRNTSPTAYGTLTPRYDSPDPRYGSPMSRYSSPTPSSGSPKVSPQIRADTSENHQSMKPISEEVKQSITRLIEFRRPKSSTPNPTSERAAVVTDAARIQALQAQMRYLLKHELTPRPDQRNAGASVSHNPQPSITSDDKTTSLDKTDKSTDFFNEFMKSLQLNGYPYKRTDGAKKPVKPQSKVSPISTASALNTPTTAVPCAKPVIPQKKVDLAPNTFARRSYMHKNKQEYTKTKTVEPKATTSDIDKLNCEIDRLIANQKLAKLKHIQNKGVKVNKTAPKSERISSETTDTLNPVKCSNTVTAQTSSAPHFKANPSATAHGASSSTLSRNDQAELLMLLCQQNKLNAVNTSQAQTIENKTVLPTTHNMTNSSRIFGIAGYNPKTTKSASALQPKSASVLPHEMSTVMNASAPEIVTSASSTQVIRSILSTPVVLKNQSTIHQNAVSYQKKQLTNKPKTDHSMMPAQTSKTKHKDTSKLSKGSHKKIENWECVLKQLLDQKTPNREPDWGPNALDMALKRDTFRKPETKLKKTVIENTKTTTQTIGNSTKPITMACANVNLPAPKTIPDKKYISSRDEKTLINQLSKKDDPFISGIPKSDYDLLEELMDEDLRKEIGEISSDEEGYSQTIERPVAEMVTDAKQNSEALNKDTQIHHTNTSVPPKSSNILSANPSFETNALVCKNTNEAKQKLVVGKQENPTTSQNSFRKVQSVPASVNNNIVIRAVPCQPAVQNMLVIGNDLIYDPFRSIQVQEANRGYVVPSGYVTVNNSTNMPMYQTQQIIATPVNRVLLGQPVTIPVKANNTTYTSVPQNIISSHPTTHESTNISEVRNISTSTNISKVPNIPDFQKVHTANMPTSEELLAAIMKDHHGQYNIHSKNVSTAGSAQTSVNLIKKVKPDTSKATNIEPTDIVRSVHHNIVQKMPINPNKKINIINDEIIKKTRVLDNALKVKEDNIRVKDDCIKTQLNLNLNTNNSNGLNTLLNDKPNSLTTQEQIFHSDIKLKDRKVLSEVQEKLTCVEKIDSKVAVIQKTVENNTDNTKYKERIKQKRLAILNRQVCQKPRYPCIPLEYASLTNSVDSSHSSELTQVNGNIEDQYVLTPDSQDDVENKSQEVESENNKDEPLPCRRILLRSSNKVNEKTKDTVGSVLIKKKRNSKTKNPISQKSVKTLNQSKKHSGYKILTTVNVLKENLAEASTHIDQGQQIIKELPVSQPSVEAHESPYCEKKETNNDDSANCISKSENDTASKILTDKEIPSLSIPITTDIAKKVDEYQFNTVSTKSIISRLRNKMALESHGNDVEDIPKQPPDSIIIPVEDSDDSTSEIDLKCSEIIHESLINYPKQNESLETYSETVVKIDDTNDFSAENKDVIRIKKIFTVPSHQNPINEAIKKSSTLQPKNFRRQYNIQIEELSDKSNDPNKKLIKMNLPNGRCLRATITGRQTPDYDGILNNPAIKSFIRDAINGCNLQNQIVKQFIPVTTQKFTSFKVVETVDLLSDDETENKITLDTEFGSFVVTNVSSEDYIKHQSRLSLKCTVKLKRCILNSYENPKTSSENMDDILKSTGVLDKLQDTLDAMVNKIKSDVIEIHDSSDEEGVLAADIKINEYKNLLLNDLQLNKNILQKRTRQEKPYCVSEVQNSIDMNIHRKCCVKLVRCDTQLTQANINIEEEFIEGCTLLSSEEENSSRPSSRNSFSILDDVPVLLPELDTNFTYQEGRNSPVMEVFELMSSLPHIFKPRGTEHLSCECEYFQTKRMFSVLTKENNNVQGIVTTKTAQNNDTKEVHETSPPSLISIIVQFINREDRWVKGVTRSKRKLPLNNNRSKISKIMRHLHDVTDPEDACPTSESLVKISTDTFPDIEEIQPVEKTKEDANIPLDTMFGIKANVDETLSQSDRSHDHTKCKQLLNSNDRQLSTSSETVVNSVVENDEKSVILEKVDIRLDSKTSLPKLIEDSPSAELKLNRTSENVVDSVEENDEKSVLLEKVDIRLDSETSLPKLIEDSPSAEIKLNRTSENVVDSVEENDKKSVILEKVDTHLDSETSLPKLIEDSPSAEIKLFEDHEYTEVRYEGVENIDFESCKDVMNPREGENEIVLNGVEINDPEIGTRYFFPIDGINENSNADLIEVIQEVVEDDVCLQSEDDLEGDELAVLIPKNTYARTWDSEVFDSSAPQRRKLRKRKLDMTDVKVSEKRYRKGKNIDCTKLTATALKESSYGMEYKRLLEYMDSVKFSYSSPFHKEYIDVPDLLQDWPNFNQCIVQIEDMLDIERSVFDDLENEDDSHRVDPMELTFLEELCGNYKDDDYPSNEQEINIFNMGFGDGSDRVIHKSKDDGNISVISAATLSDVKQSQPHIVIDKKEEVNYESQQDAYEKMKRHINYIQLKERVRSFFEKTTLAFNLEKIELTNKTKLDEKNKSTKLIQEFCQPRFIQPPLIETVVNVVQVGQLPVSAAAQNPVTCDPRVTQVSDASPSQCSIENSPNDDSQSGTKTEYTELTTAELTSLPLLSNYTEQSQLMSFDPENVSYIQGSDNITQIQISENSHIQSSESLSHSENSILHIQESEITNDSNEKSENDNMTDDIQKEQEKCLDGAADNRTLKENNENHTSYVFNTSNCSMNNASNDSIMYSVIERENTVSHNETKQQNGSVAKPDQLAHAMNAAGIATTPEPSSETVNNSRTHLVNILSQKHQLPPTTNQATTNNFTKTSSINAMALQQALAQILPQALNQNTDNNPNATIAQQVLHIVQSKNVSGNQITLLDSSQQSVINNQTPVLHIVQNKGASMVSNSGTSNAQTTNSFSGLSLVDAGLQQGGNQLLHIVNTGNQKNNNAGQVLKRVNLLTNLSNMQGSNEQKMVQFVCKSADGKSIQLNAQHQRSMVLRLQPIETPNVQTPPPKIGENEEVAAGSNSQPNKDTIAQQEIKSRSVYEENYAKFIQDTAEKPPETSNSLPKFNQAFGKPVYQDGSQKPNDINTNPSIITVTTNNAPKNTNSATSDNKLLDQMNSPPLLLRKSPAQASQGQPNLVQQIKQTIAPMNIQTMHGGVIYTRQIPVNIGGGQTINLITVPSTELVDDQNQKTLNQSDIEPSIIKIVPQGQTAPPNAETSPDDNKTQIHGDNAQNSQPQPVLTQMRIKLPMLSKAPNVVSGTRVVRPSFFQIQRNVIGGANQPVYQQLVLTAAPPLGQQVRLPQTQTRPMKVPSENSSSSESQMSSSTLEQLREFDMVLEQVKERSTVQPNGNSGTSFNKIHSTSTDATDSSTSASSTSVEPTQQLLYSIGSNQSLNVAYVRKTTSNTPATSTFSRSPDSSGIADSPSSSSHVQVSHTSASEPTTSEASQHKPAKVRSKSRSKSSSNPSSSASKVNNVPPKSSTSSSTQKPLEDEQTTQRILYILAEYKEQVENSPDKDKPAPRRRTNPPSNPGSSKRKKSGSRRSGGRDSSPVQGDDTRTMGSEDSSCGTSQGDCTENCLDSHSPQDSPRKVARKLNFDQDTAANQARPQPQRNVIVADGQTITVARGTAGKPATAVLMPANYILPVSMVKGGQQIAIVTNRGPKLLTVGGGEAGTTNALLLQRLIGPAGLKPVLRPGVRHVRLPTAALHNLQAFNLASAATTVQPPDSTASPSAPTPPELIDTRANSSPWTDRDNQEAKQDRGSSPEGSEPWNLPSSAETHDYSYEETARADHLDRTVLDDAIPDRYSPDMEAQRIFDKMFELDPKKSYILDSHDSPRCGYDIDASDDDKGYQVVHRKDGTAQRHTRLTHVSAASLRHKYAILEHELRLQKSLSEECEDLGVDSPSASELFPEAELLFAASPAQDQNTDNAQRSHTPPPTPSTVPTSIPLELEDEIARDGLVEPPALLQLGTIDHEEFARAHPNTTFHSEPTEDEAQPFTITALKARHITSTIFQAGRAPPTVLMSAPHATVISQPDHGLPSGLPATMPATLPAALPAAVKYADIDNMINSLPTTHNINLASVLVKDDRLTRFDSLLNDNRELQLTNTPSAIVHAGNATQVIRRIRYDKERPQFLLDDPDAMMGDDTKDSSRDATMESMDHDGQSSPERHTELFWESNSERSDSRRPLDYSSDSDKCCKSPSLDETNSTDSSNIGAHMRLDSVIKEARGRSCSAESSAEDTHPPLRTYPPKRLFHEPQTERSLSGKTRAGERSPDSLEVRRRASVRGVVKRGCHCCNGSPAPSRPKKSRQRKPTQDFTN